MWFNYFRGFCAFRGRRFFIMCMRNISEIIKVILLVYFDFLLISDALDPIDSNQARVEMSGI